MPFVWTGGLMDHICGCQHSLFPAWREALQWITSQISVLTTVTTVFFSVRHPASHWSVHHVTSKMFHTCAPDLLFFVITIEQMWIPPLPFPACISLRVPFLFSLALNIHEPDSGGGPSQELFSFFHLLSCWPKYTKIVPVEKWREGVLIIDEAYVSNPGENYQEFS